MENKPKIIYNHLNEPLFQYKKTAPQDKDLITLEYWRYHPRISFLKGVKENAAVADIGAGSGGLVNWRGIVPPDRNDVDMYAIDLFKSENFSLYKDYDLCNLDQLDHQKPKFARGFFDALIACHFFEHIEKKEDFLRWVFEVLKKEGTAYFEFPSIHTKELPYSGFYNEQGLEVIAGNFFEDNTHVDTPSIEEFVRLAREAGFLITATGIVHNEYLADKLLSYSYDFKNSECGMYGLWLKTYWSSYVTLKKPSGHFRVEGSP